MEGAAAAALWVPTAAPSQPTPAAADAAAAEGKCGDLETGGDGLAAEGAAKGDADGAAGVPAAGAAAERAAASGEVPPTTPKRGLLSNPYLLNVATLLALVTGAAAWAAIIKGTVEACRGLPAALSSRAAFAAGAPPGLPLPARAGKLHAARAAAGGCLCSASSCACPSP